METNIQIVIGFKSQTLYSDNIQYLETHAKIEGLSLAFVFS